MKKIMTKLFVIFLILQPLFDLQILYDDSTQIFSFSISTLLRLLMTLTLLMIVILSKKSFKENKLISIYSILIFVYSILHIINCYNFTANVTSTFNFSLTSEIFYLIRMSLPIFLIYITKNLELNDYQFKKIILINVFIYSFIIIISSIFKFGYQSYGNEVITNSIINWFTSNTSTTVNSGTRGLFVGTNRTSILLSALLALTYYFYYKEKGNRLVILIIMEIMASMILCTRIGSYVWPLVAIIMLVLYVIFNASHLSKKKILYSAFIIILSFMILTFSPIKNKEYGSDMEETFNELYINNNYGEILNKFDTISYISDSDKTYAEKVDFIESEYLNFNLRPLYVEEIYNYGADPNFWINIMKLDYDKRDDDRKIQLYISKRIYNLNNNNIDKYLGMGYSTFKSSDLYLESDIMVHFFTIGILGIIIFFGPYIFAIIYSLYFILKNIKKHCTFKLLTLNLSLCIFIFGSIMTGHILDEMITYIFISLIVAEIIYEINEIKKWEKEVSPAKISVIVPIYNVEEYLEECLDSIISQDYSEKYIEVVLIDDCSKDKSIDIARKYIRKYKNFKLIENTENKGQAISRNIAIEQATGKYIVFLDSDDKLYPKCLSTLYKEIAITGSDIVASKINSFDTKGKHGYYSDKYLNEYITSDIYGNKKLINCISICSKIYKANFIKNIKFLENTIHEDNSFTLTCLFKANKITVVPEYLYYRRIREGENKSIMQKLNYKTFTDLIKNYKVTLQNIVDKKSKTFLHLYMLRKLNNEICKHISKDSIALADSDIITFIEEMNISNFKKTMYKIYNKIYRKIVNIYVIIKR